MSDNNPTLADYGLQRFDSGEPVEATPKPPKEDKARRLVEAIATGTTKALFWLCKDWGIVPDIDYEGTAIKLARHVLEG